VSFREGIERIHRLAAALDRPVTLMEVCGTHTMAAFRSGLRTLLPGNVRLLSGPGCPVCVTPDDYVDLAIAIAREPGVILATFGDMLRVPGTVSSLERARAEGAEVRVVYSPLDALAEARRCPDRDVVFLGVGFETTAPAVAWTIRAAAEEGLRNYLVLCGHKTMPNAMAALLRGGEVRIDGFICPGHVSAIIGAGAYEFICRDFGVPCVVAGFEPADIAAAVEMLLSQTTEGRAQVEIQYSRCVGRDGNRKALVMLDEAFEECDAEWRGLGNVPASGLRIREELAAHDAARRFGRLAVPPSPRPSGCRCGEVLRGVISPPECPLFGTGCTPATPAGACMVSQEGACAAFYRYGSGSGAETAGRSADASI